MTDGTNEALVDEYQRTNNPEVLAELCERNSGLVFMITKEFRSVYEGESASRAAITESNDISQSGYIGLMRAIKNYEPDRGASFVTVAALSIRGEILKNLDNTGRLIRIPVYKIAELRRLRSYRAQFTVEHGRNPTRDEIAAFLGVDGERVDKLIKLEIRANIASLNAPTGDDGDEITLEDTIPGAVDPIEQLENDMMNEELRREIWAAVDSLEPDQAAILHRYYEDGESMSEIGARLNVSGKYAARMKKKALSALRNGQCRITLDRFSDKYCRAESVAYRGTVGGFLRHHTSATEQAALMRIEAGEAAAQNVRTRAKFGAAGLTYDERRQYFEMLQQEKQREREKQLKALKEDF